MSYCINGSKMEQASAAGGGMCVCVCVWESPSAFHNGAESFWFAYSSNAVLRCLYKEPQDVAHM